MVHDGKYFTLTMFVLWFSIQRKIEMKKKKQKNALYRGMSALFKVIFPKCFRTISNQHYSS